MSRGNNGRRRLCVYTTPKLVKFGTFRELTLVGLSNPDGDGFFFYGDTASQGASGCELGDPFGKCRS